MQNDDERPSGPDGNGPAAEGGSGRAEDAAADDSVPAEVVGRPNAPAAGAGSADPWAVAAAVPEEAPRRRPGARVLSLLMAAAIVVAAVFAGQSRTPAQVRHVADGPPAVEQPTGALAGAFDLAREATARVEARCGGAYRGETIGLGTGFFIRDDGLLLTAYHVVDEPAADASCPVSFVAVTPEEQEYPLSLVGFDAYMDLAVLKADVHTSVPVVPLAARAPAPGTKVVAIGNSRNQFLQARAGNITRLGVHAGRADFADNTIEMTNALAPGDSGGPVINDRGEAVGVVSYISYNPGAMTTDSYVPPFLRGVQLPQDFASYAVPVTDTSDLLRRIVAGERRDVPVIGFTWRRGLDYDPTSSDVYLGPRPGPIVWQVERGGPADSAGLRDLDERPVPQGDGTVKQVPVADVIVAVDGSATPSFYDLLAVVRHHAIGDTVTLTVQRGSATYRLPLTLAAKRSVFDQP